jgi:hypothetical protein
VETLVNTQTQTHPGLFFELDGSTLANLKRAGYRAIGVGLVLLNPSGQVLIANHKENHKLPDRIKGVTSETVGGRIESGRVVAESILQTIGRCIIDELEVALDEVVVTSRVDQHYVLSDWPVSAKSAGGKLLGINIPLLADEATAARFAAARDTRELHSTEFIDAYDVMCGSIDFIRPGTRDCLRNLDDMGLLDPSNLTEATLAFPDCPEPQFDIDLTRL